MRRQNIIFCYLIVSLLCSAEFCYASTCQITNFMDQANGVVNNVTTKVKGYADQTNGFMQGKIGNLGDINAVTKKAEKVKKTKQRLQKAQAKAKKLKAAYDKAKEKKAALDAGIKKAKDKANELKSQYEAAQKKLAEAKSKINDVKDKIDDVKDKVNDVKDKIDDVKDKVNDVKDKVNDVKDKIDEVQDKLDVEKIKDAPEDNENIESEDVKVELPKEDTVTSIEKITGQEEAVSTDVNEVADIPLDMLQNDLTVEDVSKLSEATDLQLMDLNEKQSNLTLDEQLQNLGKFTKVKAVKDVKISSDAKLIKKGNREKFEQVAEPKALEENLSTISAKTSSLKDRINKRRQSKRR